MRTAIISDIHGNLEALLEVLSDIDRKHVDRAISLGDNIGYGPDPDDVLRSLHAKSIQSVMGNHELGIVDPSYLGWFNSSARRSLIVTRGLLSPWSFEHIASFKANHEMGSGLCVHGFPPDSVTTYLFQVSDEKLLHLFLSTPFTISFVGHTHELGLVCFDGEKVVHAPLAEGLLQLHEGRMYIVNSGSVGQPRDGDNRAKYLIWDDAALSLEVRYIPYNIEKTVRKILDLGFPRINADRLW